MHSLSFRSWRVSPALVSPSTDRYGRRRNLSALCGAGQRSQVSSSAVAPQLGRMHVDCRVGPTSAARMRRIWRESRCQALAVVRGQLLARMHSLEAALLSRFPGVLRIRVSGTPFCCFSSPPMHLCSLSNESVFC